MGFVNGLYSKFQFLLRYVCSVGYVRLIQCAFCYTFSWIGLCMISRKEIKHIGKSNTIYLVKERIGYTQIFIHTHILGCFFGYTLTTFPLYAASGLHILLWVDSNMTPTSHYFLAFLDFICIVSNVTSCITQWRYTIVETALEHKIAVSDAESDSKWRLFHGWAIK